MVLSGKDEDRLTRSIFKVTKGKSEIKLSLVVLV